MAIEMGGRTFYTLEEDLFLKGKKVYGAWVCLPDGRKVRAYPEVFAGKYHMEARGTRTITKQVFNYENDFFNANSFFQSAMGIRRGSVVISRSMSVKCSSTHRYAIPSPGNLPHYLGTELQTSPFDEDYLMVYRAQISMSLEFTEPLNDEFTYENKEYVLDRDSLEKFLAGYNTPSPITVVITQEAKPRGPYHTEYYVEGVPYFAFYNSFAERSLYMSPGAWYMGTTFMPGPSFDDGSLHVSDMFPTLTWDQSTASSSGFPFLYNPNQIIYRNKKTGAESKVRLLVTYHVPGEPYTFITGGGSIAVDWELLYRNYDSQGNILEKPERSGDYRPSVDWYRPSKEEPCRIIT